MAEGRRPTVQALTIRRLPIPPFLVAYYVLGLAAIVVAWLKGGYPERLGVVASVAFFGIAIFTHTWRIGTFYAGDTLTDLGLTLFFGWLALRTDRWWPLAMTAVLVLTLLVHAASVLLPDMHPYANVSARIGLGILSALILLKVKPFPGCAATTPRPAAEPPV